MEHYEYLTLLIQEISEYTRFNINLMWAILGFVTISGIATLTLYARLTVKKGIINGTKKALDEIKKINDTAERYRILELQHNRLKTQLDELEARISGTEPFVKGLMGVSVDEIEH